MEPKCQTRNSQSFLDCPRTHISQEHSALAALTLAGIQGSWGGCVGLIPPGEGLRLRLVSGFLCHCSLRYPLPHLLSGIFDVDKEGNASPLEVL